MSKVSTNYQDFEFEQFYRLHTSVSGGDQIFRNDSNYIFFLQKISKYLLPIMEVHGYVLLPHKFELLVLFRAKNEIMKNLHLEEKELTKEREHRFLMQPISNFLNSYAKAYNKMFQRKGALFVDYIKRDKLEDEESLIRSLCDIHMLPVQHHLVSSPQDWKYSSYGSYLNLELHSSVSRSFLLDLFGNKQNFVEMHTLRSK